MLTWGWPWMIGPVLRGTAHIPARVKRGGMTNANEVEEAVGFLLRTEIKRFPTAFRCWRTNCAALTDANQEIGVPPLLPASGRCETGRSTGGVGRERREYTRRSSAFQASTPTGRSRSALKTQ